MRYFYVCKGAVVPSPTDPTAFQKPPLRRMAHEHIECAFTLSVFFSALKDFFKRAKCFRIGILYNLQCRLAKQVYQ